MQRQNVASFIGLSRVLWLSLLVVMLGGLLEPEAAQTVSFGANTDFGTGVEPVSVAVGDFNGDGKLDLAVANAAADTVSILLNNTPPSITAAPVTRTAGNPSGNSQIALVNDVEDAPNTLSVTVNGGTSATDRQRRDSHAQPNRPQRERPGLRRCRCRLRCDHGELYAPRD